jgi:hypothetical protein
MIYPRLTFAGLNSSLLKGKEKAVLFSRLEIYIQKVVTVDQSAKIEQGEKSHE